MRFIFLSFIESCVDKFVANFPQTRDICCTEMEKSEKFIDQFIINGHSGTWSSEIQLTSIFSLLQFYISSKKKVTLHKKVIAVFSNKNSSKTFVKFNLFHINQLIYRYQCLSYTFCSTSILTDYRTNHEPIFLFLSNLFLTNPTLNQHY